MEANILSTLVFLPLIAGFVMLFLPDRFKSFSKGLTVIISVMLFVWSWRLFGIAEPPSYAWTILTMPEAPAPSTPRITLVTF